MKDHMEYIWEHQKGGKKTRPLGAHIGSSHWLGSISSCVWSPFLAKANGKGMNCLGT
jgi:hypothetical protein